MKPIRILAFFLFTLILVSCEKDLIQEPEIKYELNESGLEQYYESPLTNEDITIRSKTDDDDKSDQSDIRDIFRYLVENKVITNEFVLETGYPDWNFYEKVYYENSELTIIPTTISGNCEISGVWYYYHDSTNDKVFYDNSRSFKEEFLISKSSKNYSVNALSRAYKFFHFQFENCGQLDVDYHTIYTTIRNDEGDNPDGEEFDGNNENGDVPCIGGTFVDIQSWVYDPSGSDAFEIAYGAVLKRINDLKKQLIEQYADTHKEEHANWALDLMNNYLDFTAYSGLQDVIDKFKEISPDSYEAASTALEYYLNFRAELAELRIGLGKSGIRPYIRTENGGELHWNAHTINLWIDCWDQYPDFDVTVGPGSDLNPGGGGNSIDEDGDGNPDHWPDMLELQNCFTLNDVHDIDPESGGNDNSTFTGDVELCTKWNKYKEDCLSDDFAGVVASNYYSAFGQGDEDAYDTWGELKHNYPNLFNSIISGDHGCISSEQAEQILNSGDTVTPIEDCDSAVKNFLNSYGLEVDKPQLMLLSGIDCTADDYEDQIKLTLINQLELNITDDEKQYIVDNFHIFKDLVQIIYENGEDLGKSSAEIYTKLAALDMLNVTYTQLEEMESLLDEIISGTLSINNLDDRNAISASTWYMIFQAEANDNGGGVFEWLRAEVLALKDGFIEIFKPLAHGYATLLSNSLDELGLPSSPEEWRAVMAVFGPMLLELGVDIGTDFIPIVGEVKAFTKAGIAFANNKYGEALFEFIGGVAGIIPIGDLLTAPVKVVKAGSQIFFAFKLVKSVARVSGSVYSKLIEWAQAGWRIVWDEGLKKLIFKNGGNKVGEIDEDGVPNIIKNIFKSIIDPSTFKKLTPKVLTNSDSGNSISRTFINKNANKFNVTEPNLKSRFDYIVTHGDKDNPPGWGKRTERLIKDIIEDEGSTGYRYADGSYNGPVEGVNGFDGVFINDETGEVIINESKQWTNGSVRLSGHGAVDPNTNIPWPAQMTDEWVDAVVQEIRTKYPNNSDKLATANAIERAKDEGLLTKIVTVVDRTPQGNSGGLLGGINIIKVE